MAPLVAVQLDSADDLRLVSATPLPLLAIDFFRLATAALPLRPPLVLLAKLCLRTGMAGGLVWLVTTALEATAVTT